MLSKRALRSEDQYPEKWVEVPGKLWKLLDEIPRQSRLILVLFHIEGSSCKEIARFLDLTEEAVRTHLERAESHVLERAPWIRLAELAVGKPHHQRLQQQIMASLRGIPRWRLSRERGKRQDERRPAGEGGQKNRHRA